MPDPRPAARAQLLGVFDIRGCDADGGQDGDASRGRWRHVCTAPPYIPAVGLDRNIICMGADE
jgi:hypothetical protein